ncbi:MAG: MFS transporter [Casimicrobiaceae bacterium]
MHANDEHAQSFHKFHVHEVTIILNTGPAWLWALVAAVAMQTACAFSTRVFPVLGPTLTEAATVSPEDIGYLAAVGSLGTLWWLVAGGGLLVRLGPGRSMQVGATIGAVGLLLATTGYWPVLMLASFLIGLGYGSTPAAGSEVLNQYAPARHHSLMFSIKQAGVPLGGVVAGLLVPIALVAVGWQFTCVGAAMLVILTCFLIEPLSGVIDRNADRQTSLRLGSFVDPRMLTMPFRSLAQNPSLQRVTIASLCFAMVQGCVVAFFVTYLTVDLGASLLFAGFAFSAMQVTGVAGRIFAGWLADRLGSRRIVIVGLALASTIAVLLLAGLEPSSPQWAIQGLAGVVGVASSSWNGVFLAEVSRLVPKRKVGDATAAATFFTFIGYVLGPAAFGALLTHGGSYRAAFAVLAVIPLAGIAVMILPVRR